MYHLLIKGTVYFGIPDVQEVLQESQQSDHPVAAVTAPPV